MKTYKKTHKKKEVLIKHAEKITERGGSWEVKGLTITYKFKDEDLSLRFFSIIKSVKWTYGKVIYVRAENHKKAIFLIDKKTKRITNTRFRQIEKIGSFYSVAEQGKGGKIFIFEVI